MADKPIIKVKDVSVRYFKGKPNEFVALNKANLEIYPGEFVIFFGPSGCGKSTLLYTIAGLETDIEGSIHIDDQDINKLKGKSLENFHQTKIGMVFQAYYLIGSLSVLKNVILPQVARRGVSNKERKKKALDMLAKFGVDHVSHRYPTELSGGQQQRVATSRALINDPDILLADEPVGNLDSKSADDVMSLFRELNETQKRTTVLVTHDPSRLDVAHRVFYMKDGEIIKVKRNREMGQKYVDVNVPVQDASGEKDMPVNKELRMLEDTYADLSTEGAGALLESFKAKEIVYELMTGMTSNELTSVEEYVERLLSKGIDDKEKLFNYLDKNIKEGGLGLDKRTARKMTKNIKEVVKKVSVLEKEEKGGHSITPQAVTKISIYLLNEFKVRLRRQALVERFDKAITDRLSNQIDKRAFRDILNLGVAKGGLGINIRVAKRVSNRLELLILGKYKNHYQQD